MVTSRLRSMPLLSGDSTETILIAEDEPIIARSTARVLERHGYCVLWTIDGLEALNVFERNKDAVDLVLLDMEMPKMGGSECMRHLLQRAPNLKIIALSGHLLEPQVWDPVEEGACAFVQKPFGANLLLSVIRSVLGADPSLPQYAT